MTKYIKGLGFYLIIFAVIMAAIYLTETLSEQKADEYSYSQFLKDVKGTVNKSKNVNKVSRVEVAQNKEVPTGYIVIYFEDENEATQKLDVTDTSKVEAKVPYSVVVHWAVLCSWRHPKAEANLALLCSMKPAAMHPTPAASLHKAELTTWLGF